VDNGNAGYSRAADDEVREVILRAMAGKLTWWQAAEIIGVTDRTTRRWRQNYEEFGHDGLFGNAASLVQSEFLWRPSSEC